MADFEDSNTPTWDNVDPGPDQPARRGRPHASSSPSPEGKDYGSTRTSRRCWCARAAGTCSRSTSSSTATPVPGRPLRLRRSTSSTTRRRCSSAARARTSTCRRWRATSRRASGTTSSSWRRTQLGVPHGTIRATVLIETILAAFEMDEILYELRDHSAGLNCGRWDYIFSFIKKFRERPATSCSPTASQVTMTIPFMRAYALLRDQDLPPARRPRDRRHGGADPDQERPGRQRRGAREGARRQGARGQRRPRRHLGRPPGPGADRREAFDAVDDRPEPDRPPARGRPRRRRRTCSTSCPEGPITEAGLRTNISVGVQYLGAWLRGNGACRSTT